MDEQQRITDYLSGELTPEERQRFDEWLAEQPEREQVFQRMARTWLRIKWANRWGTPDEQQAYERVAHRLRRHRIRRNARRYAATVLLLLTSGLSLLLNQPEEQPAPVASTLPAPGEARPVLTLGNGRTVVLTDAVRKTPVFSGKENICFREAGELEYLPQEEADTVVEYNTLSIPYGCEFSLLLADGSRVWLNASSTLKYPERFAANRREVWLDGEAYFEVTPSATAPFIVRTCHMELEVLGTSFNVCAYAGDERTVTTLLTGRISQTFDGVDAPLLLAPSRQSIYSAETHNIVVRPADTEEVMAWKEGKFIARNRPLGEIMEMLAKWYDFKVVYTRPQLKEEKFHLHCPRYTELQEVLATLQSTRGIRFNRHNGTVYVSQ